MEPQQADVASPAAILAPGATGLASAAATAVPSQEQIQASQEQAQPASAPQNSTSTDVPQITTTSAGSAQASNNADEQPPPGLAHLAHIGLNSKRNSAHHRTSSSGQVHSEKISLEQVLAPKRSTNYHKILLEQTSQFLWSLLVWC